MVQVLVAEQLSERGKRLAEEFRNKGITTVVADSPLQVAELFRSGEFSAVVVDAEFPVFEILRNLRQAETGKRTPIVALTAPGIVVDVTALAIDAVVEHSRPRDVISTIEKLVADSGVPEVVPLVPGDIPIFARDDALARVDNDHDFLNELFTMFFEDYGASRELLTRAVQERDWKGIEERAHSLKSALANIGGMRASRLCFRLELAGKKQVDDQVDECCKQLAIEIENFKSVVARS